MTATLGAATTAGATTRLPRRRGRLKRVPPIIWAFLLVPLLFEMALIFWPAVNSFYISLTKWNGAGAPEFIGLRNFTDLTSDPVFATALGNTVIWMIGFGGASIVAGLCLAVALNKPRRFVGLYRGAIYLPMVFSLAVTGLFWRLLYQPEGAVNSTLGAIGLGSLEQQWLADPSTALYAVLIAAVWRQCGYIMVLYLAGLKGVDPTLEEAAAVDGATRWQRFWRIVMPQLRGVNTVVIAVTVIDSLRTFDIVWAMTRGGPYDSTQLLSTYMYQTSFSTVNLGYGSAIAVVIFLLAVVFIIGYLVRASREED